MFSVEERDRVRDKVLELAERDDRVVAAAVVGSLTFDQGDRWSDIDLTFAVSDEVSVGDVLDDWTDEIVRAFDALHVLDLTAGPTLYRVFFLPELLQLDVSFTPASEFAPTSERFRLLFGEALPPKEHPPPTERELLGWAILWSRYARTCIERERWWQAEYSISQVRYYGLSLACLRRGLPPTYGKGIDRLPGDLLKSYAPSLVRSVDREELLRALSAAVDALAGRLSEEGADALILQRLREAVTTTSSDP